MLTASEPISCQERSSNTPLDRFFHSFLSFTYDLSIPPVTSYGFAEKTTKVAERQQGKR